MQRLVKSLFYVIYIVIVGGLLAAIVLTFHQSHASAPAKTSKLSQTARSQTSTKSQRPISISHKKASSKSSSTSSQSPVVVSSKPNTAPTSARNLTNTGPGDSIGLFAGASLLAGLLYRRHLLRQII
jgi:cytoskeletal protein RodZ